MLIRILRPRRGEIEGVELSDFDVGATYDVAPSLATYLIVTQSAEAVEPSAHRAPDPREKREFRGAFPPLAIAADRQRRK